MLPEQFADVHRSLSPAQQQVTEEPIMSNLGGSIWLKMYIFAAMFLSLCTSLSHCSNMEKGKWKTCSRMGLFRGIRLLDDSISHPTHCTFFWKKWNVYTLDLDEGLYVYNLRVLSCIRLMWIAILLFFNSGWKNSLNYNPWWRILGMFSVEVTPTVQIPGCC